MNPISAFFVRNIIVVFFFYGLSFFVMGLALLLASRRQSEFHFARAILPLAAFGILHGLHEWYEMYQKYASLTAGYIPGLWEEGIRLGLMVISFVALLVFSVKLLNAGHTAGYRQYLPLVGMVSLWGVGTATVAIYLRPESHALIAAADALARYSLAVPGAMLGTWALMAQQRTFREHKMPQFGRDLVWCAAALFLFGVGQIFVRPTLLFPSPWLNSTLFLQWFGIPVQLFRGAMAAVMTFYMVHALNAFEVESQRRLFQALQAERYNRREVERLNDELRLTARELSLLLTLSNDLTLRRSLEERLARVLDAVVSSLSYSTAGMILLVGRDAEPAVIRAETGFAGEGDPHYGLARELGERSTVTGLALCRHGDGSIVEFLPEAVMMDETSWQQLSPAVAIALPLLADHSATGSLVLACPGVGNRIPVEELQLMAGIARQLALSIENAQLTWRTQRHERLLADLLDQVVDAQEDERQRIARELHDATGQSLTAISLGLRGVGKLVEIQAPLVAPQLREIEGYSTGALAELRRIIADLRPPQLDDLGLVAALRWYTQAFAQRRSIATEFILLGEPVRLPAEVETVLFRITQEALTNVAKHANAGRATVTLAMAANEVAITIADDGAGFDTEAILNGERHASSGWGLLGIRERARLLGGRCAIQSAPGEGSRIHVEIPLQKEKSDVEDTALVG